jgi:hypothetical protein
MPLIQKISKFYYKKLKDLQPVKIIKLGIVGYNPAIFLCFIVFFFILFFAASSLISNKNNENKDSLIEVSNSGEFFNIKHYIISKINSPYQEVSYTIKNNDTIEKILKNYNIKAEDIKNISIKLKEKKLSNIYSGRKFSLIYKKLENKSNAVINLIYPISNTSSVEIRKTQDNFLIKENILQLYKKEVVVKNIIKNNLYSSAVESGIEPNIIVEFARIFGFEVDFQRDIRKGDCLKFFMKNLKMTTIK